MTNINDIKTRWAKAARGPWRVDHVQGQTCILSAQAPGLITPWIRDADFSDCNANAIAAAPDDIAYLVERLGRAEALLQKWAVVFEWDVADQDYSRKVFPSEVAAFLAEVGRS